jgi:hypothetical protein
MHSLNPNPNPIDKGQAKTIYRKRYVDGGKPSIKELFDRSVL